MLKKYLPAYTALVLLITVILSGSDKQQIISHTLENDNIISFEEPYTLASNERVVKTYAELKDALSGDNGITAVYFGSNITMQLGGIRINPKKTDIVVDGFNPLDPGQLQPYTLTDYSSSSFYDTIYIDAAGPRTLLVRDLKITGKNYYTPFSVYDTAALADIVITYERIDYNGPQFVYHRKGTAHFVDCKVSIQGGNGGSPNQEFSEVKNLVFEGTNTIDTKTSTTSIFWQPSGGTFKIADNSSLSLISESTSTTYGMFYAGGSANKVDITVGMSAVFDISISGIVAPTAYVILSGLTVQESGSFYLTTTKEAAAAVLTMGGPLTVRQNASFKINGYGGSDYTLLDQKTGDITIDKDATFHMTAAGEYSRLIDLYGRALICNDPASILLYNAKRDIQATTSAGRVYVSAEQINIWDTVSPGGLDKPAKYRWKKADGTNFWIDGTISIGAAGDFSTPDSNYTEGDLPGKAPSATTFSMAGARVLAFGRLDLNVSTPVITSPSISGITAPGAIVRASFTQDDIDYKLPDVEADSDGIFYIPLDIRLKPYTEITVRSSWQYLTALSKVIVSDMGKVDFTVPEYLEFLTTEISLTTHIVGRLHTNWNITVSDTRGSGNEWSIYARLVKPLTPSDPTRPVLENALVFVDNDYVSTPLTTTETLLIYNHTTILDNETISVHWPADRGILAKIQTNTVYSELPYTGVIEWIFSEVP